MAFGERVEGRRIRRVIEEEIPGRVHEGEGEAIWKRGARRSLELRGATRKREEGRERGRAWRSTLQQNTTLGAKSLLSCFQNRERDRELSFSYSSSTRTLLELLCFLSWRLTEGCGGRPPKNPF
jgi:hypothetical protein